MSDFKPGIMPGNETFNHDAARENVENKKHIKLTHGGGITTLAVDSHKVKYNGTEAWLLSDEQKKKLENRILFTFLPELKQIPIVQYV